MAPRQYRLTRFKAALGLGVYGGKTLTGPFEHLLRYVLRQLPAETPCRGPAPGYYRIGDTFELAALPPTKGK